MLEWIVSSAALCALVIALRYLLRGKIGLRLQYALWGLVLLRLLLPVSFGGSRLSLMNALPGERELPASAPTAYTLPDAGAADPLPASAPVPASPGTLASTPRTEAQPAPAAPGTETAAEPGKAPLDTGRLLKLPWMAGSAACLLWFAGVNLRFALRLRRSRKPFSGAEDFPLPVYVTAAAETPCLFGLFRPAVYLPPEAAEDPSLDHILAHEYTHFRHGDQAWSLLRSLAVSLHWFDPLAWWAAFLSRRDGELACDEGTLRRLGEEERTAYGMTLLRMTCSSRPALFRAATTMTGSKAGLKERIRLIAKRPRTAVLTLVAVILIAALALGCTFTGARPEGTEEESHLDGLKGIALSAAQACAKENSLSLTGDVYSGGTGDNGVFLLFATAKDGVYISVNCDQGEDGTWALCGTPPVRLTDRYSGIRVENGAADAPLGAVSVAQSFVYNLVYNMNAGLPWESLFTIGWQPTQISHTADYEPESEAPDVNRIVRARITGLTPMGTGTGGLTEGRDLYRLEYRLLPEDQENIVLCSGMRTEVIDGETWITEWTESGQPYLLIGWEDPEGGPSGNPEEPLWVWLGTTNTRQLEEIYGTPEMLEKYGNAWLAASVEMLSAGEAQEPVRAISLQHSDVTLRPGESFLTTATLSSALEGETITWRSEDTHVATVSPEGTVTAVDHGTTRIIASAGGVTAQCIVRVHGAALESVQSEPDVFTEGQLRWVEESETAVWIAAAKLTLREGDSYPQLVEISSALRGKPITWISEDPAVAAVNDKGVITGVTQGTTKVRISVGEYSAECTVQVKKYPPDPEAENGGITLSYSYLILLSGQRCTLTAVLSSALAGEEITWSSSDPAVATVSPEGLVTAMAPGNAVILASAGDWEADCRVSVAGGESRMATEEDGFPKNERGETYGPIWIGDDRLTTICPDLVQTYGRTPEGEEILGYIRVFDEYNGGPVPHPRDPGEAIAYTAAMEELRREALEEGRDYLYALPLYDKDGVTVIGYFPVGNV